jgi:DNA-binding beta-propeller fold protein YncE
MAGARLALATIAAFLIATSTAGATALYVESSGSGEVLPYSIAADGSVTPIACASGCKANGGWGPVVTPNGRYLYATNIGNGSSNGSVAGFSIDATGKPSLLTCSPASNCTTQFQPEGLAISPSGRYLYVASNKSSSVSGFAIAADGSLRPVSTTATPANPQSLAITPDGRFLYLTVGAELALFAIASDGTLTALPCSGPPCSSPSGGSFGTVAIAPSGRYMYAVEGSGSVVPRAIGANGSLTNVPCPGTSCAGTGAGGYSLAISPSGGYLYVTDEPHTLLADAVNADGTLTPKSCGGACDVGVEPLGLAMSPAGNALYAVDYVSSTLLPFSIGAGGLPSLMACVSCGAGSQVAYLQTIAAQPDQAPTATLAATAASAGSASSFDAGGSSASDGGHVVRWDWNLGDGTELANAGPRVQHTYAAPGTYVASVTVTDQDGCSTALIFTGQTAYCNGGSSATATRVVSVPAAPTATTPSVIVPSITRVSQSHRRWRLGRMLPSIATAAQSKSKTGRAPVGTTFSLSLNERASVSFTFTQQVSGRRVGHRCVAQTNKNRRKRACKLSVMAGTLSFAGHAGTNKVAFQGRLSRSRKLKPGTYTLTITAANSAGARSAPASLRFTIVR